MYRETVEPLLEVTNIAWERVNLTLTLAVDPAIGVERGEPLTVSVVDRHQKLPVDWHWVGDDSLVVRINVTRFHNRAAVPNGSWRFHLSCMDELLAVAGFDVGNLEYLDQASRNFIYAGNHAAYTVTFGLSENEEAPELIMRTYQFSRGRGKGSSNPLRRLQQTLRKKRKSAKEHLLRAYYHLNRISRPRKRPEVLFASSQHAKLGGNLLAVHERMVERGLTSRYSLTQSFRSPRTSTKWSTLEAIRLLARAEIVLLDDYFPMLDTLPIAENSKVIQLWHAGSGFKNVGYSRFGKYGSPTLRNAHRKYNYAICGSTALVPVYAEAFGIEEEAVIPTGLPRLDGYLHEDRVAQFKNKFYQEFPDLTNKRIILFAPTFRGRGIHDAYYNYSWINFHKLYEQLGADNLFVFKMHPFIPDRPPIPANYRDKIKDLTAFPNINDLLYVADVLVTDYSSVIYEYSLFNRPIIFFAPDKDVYGAIRGFHGPYDEMAPGEVCTSFDSLLPALVAKDGNAGKRAKFLENNFDYFDSGSSDRVIDWLILGERVE